MVDMTSLKRSARIVRDQTGEPVVQIPLSLWQEWLAESDPEHSQLQQINRLLQSWEDESDEMPQGWWDEFRQFLKDNRLDLETHDPNHEDR